VGVVSIQIIPLSVKEEGRDGRMVVNGVQKDDANVGKQRVGGF
jgi:hypothetical protein